MEEVLIFEMTEHCEDLLRGSMNKKFTIELCSDLDFEEMVVDISYENQPIAMITQENGLENMEIEIYLHALTEENFPRKFLLSEFLEALNLAKKWLIESQKKED